MSARDPLPSRKPWGAFGVALFVLAGAGPQVTAQTPTVEPVTIGGVTLSGSLRTRLESWDWFGGAANGTYVYPGTLLRVGLSQDGARLDWNAEVSVPVLVALPEQPPGTGPAGLGANYFLANHRQREAVGVFPKQAFMRVKDLGGTGGQSLKVGRMEFFDGAETVPTNATLAAIKGDRVASRLLANFGFTHVQRSFDGAQYALDRPGLNVTVLAARPTQGVFQVNGWGDLRINVVYGALTRQVGGATTNAGDWRVFGLAYSDQRDGVTKTDNRPLATRRLDHGHVNMTTFGGHYIGAMERAPGTVDLLVWGGAQIGSWGDLAHRAGALAAEGGWQPHTRFAPWIRGGFDYASGDDDPNDTTYGTFFQVLPTPRQYARFPFFNLMNSADAFGELALRPFGRMRARMEVHSLHVADGHDLWYQGGGAFQPATFGYIGQGVGGQRKLATLYDVGADVTVSARWAISVYYAYASGGPASAVSYATHNAATLAYLEVLIRF